MRITTKDNIKRIADVDGVPTYEAFIPSTADGVIKERKIKSGIRYDATIVVGYKIKYQGDIKWHKDIAELTDMALERKRVTKVAIFKTYEDAIVGLEELKAEYGIGAEYKTNCFGYKDCHECGILTDFYSGPLKCKNCPFFKTKLQAEFDRNKAESRARQKQAAQFISATCCEPGFLITSK